MREQDILIVDAGRSISATLVASALAAAGGGFTHAFETMGEPIVMSGATGSAFDIPPPRITVVRDIDPRAPRTHKHWLGGSRSAFGAYKGSSDAKRAARQVRNKAKAGRRKHQARKHVMACAHGLARDWYARWEAGMPVNFSYQDARDYPVGGAYARAMALLVKRLGSAHTWHTAETRGVIQLQGPPCARRPLPTYPVA